MTPWPGSGCTAFGRMQLVFRDRHPLVGPEAASRFAERYLTELDRLVLGHRQCGGRTP
jgi:hypothetical protein